MTSLTVMTIKSFGIFARVCGGYAGGSNAKIVNTDG
jgi:hypothetical protein